MGNTSIEWTDKSWNPIRGCSVVSEGCRNCYAMQVAARFSGDDPKTGKPLAYKGLAYRNESGAHWTGEVKLIESHLDDPLRWRKPARIFVNSMSDLFHESIPDEWIDRVFAVMALAPRHTFQILTKRPQRMSEYLDERRNIESAVAAFEDGARRAGHTEEVQCQISNSMYSVLGDGLNVGWPMRNVWLGVSVEDQKTADERIPFLLETPAAVRWLSVEPLLGPIELSDVTKRSDAVRRLGKGSFDGIHWVVVGGESGPKARPMNPEWARSLREQCTAAGVPFFFKQHGEWIDEDNLDSAHLMAPQQADPEEYFNSHLFDTTHFSYRVGKKAAGRMLDGRTWDQFPTVNA